MVDHFFGSFRAGSAALRLSISSFRFFLSSSFDLVYKNILVRQKFGPKRWLDIGARASTFGPAPWHKMVINGPFQLFDRWIRSIFSQHWPFSPLCAIECNRAWGPCDGSARSMIINLVLYQLLVEHSAHHHLALSTMHCTNKKVIIINMKNQKLTLSETSWSGFP